MFFVCLDFVILVFISILFLIWYKLFYFVIKSYELKGKIFLKKYFFG